VTAPLAASAARGRSANAGSGIGLYYFGAPLIVKRAQPLDGRIEQRLDVGNAAEWFAAVGTVGALLAMLGFHVSDVTERKRAHARRVAVWSEWDRREQGDSPRQFYAYVLNSGEAPVYVHRLFAATERGSGPAEIVEFGIVAPQDRQGWGLSVDTFPPDGAPPFVEILFTDVEEQLWRRDSQGALRREQRMPSDD
jgi:hypothetical protein